MMILRRKQKQAFRTLLRLIVALAISLTLFLGAVAFSLPGFSLLSIAHAMERSTTVARVPMPSRCASQPGAQTCTNQDPVVQGCETDAQTLAFKELLDAHGNLLATLQRRYSPTCHSEWGRILDTGKEPLEIVVNKQVHATSGTVAYSIMVFVPNLSSAPEIMGIVSINGISPAQAGGAGQETTLPAVIPVQNPK